MFTSITEDHASEVCKKGQGPACCSYLAMDRGYVCVKSDRAFKATVDERRNDKLMKAMGDNCSGPPDFTPK